MVVSRLCDCLRVLRERGRERRSAELESPRESREVQRGMGCEDVCAGPPAAGVRPGTCADCESMRCGRADGVSARAALSPDRRVIWETRFDHTPNLHNSDITKFHCLPAWAAVFHSSDPPLRDRPHSKLARSCRPRTARDFASLASWPARWLASAAACRSASPRPSERVASRTIHRMTTLAQGPAVGCWRRRYDRAASTAWFPLSQA